jgi:hypothetical protein
MSLAFLFPYLMLNMFRVLIQPSSGACDLFVVLFHGLYGSGTMRVGVTVWFGWCGEVSGCRLKPASVLILLANCQHNLYDIYHCCVYSKKLLTMDRGTV